MTSNFMTLAIERKYATAHDFDDAVEEWHEGDSEVSLHEHLGMTRDEYRRVIENSAAITDVILERLNAN